MKKFFICILLMLISIPVYAKEDTFYYDSERVEEMWITKVNGEQTRSAHPYLIKRRSDNSYIYCLEPFVLLENDSKYVVDNDYTKYGLTKEEIDRINLIIYYGYGYGNHTSDVWYGVTQYLIWKESDKEADIYFTSEKNGTREDLYVNEIKEIEDLIISHNIEPNFIKDYKISIDSELVIQSNVNLKDYEIVTDIKYNIDDNKLVFDTSVSGSYKVLMKKKSNRFNSDYLLYHSESSQDVIIPGNSDVYAKEYEFNIDILEGKVVLEKISSFDNTKLAGAKYGIYKEDLLVKELITLENGMAEVSLPFGEYYLKEIEAPPGYKLDTTIYKFVVDENNLNVKLSLKDDRIVIEVPNTGLKSKKYSSLCFLFIGVVLLLYGKKECNLH